MISYTSTSINANKMVAVLYCVTSWQKVDGNIRSKHNEHEKIFCSVSRYKYAVTMRIWRFQIP